MIGTIGNIYIEKNPTIDYACKNMGIFKFNGNKDDAYWMYYYLKSPQAVEYIHTHLRGSTQSYVPLGGLREIPIPIPPLETRRRIVSILQSIDQRIEVNIAISDNLQQQILSILFSILDVDHLPLVKLGKHLYIKGRIGWKGLKKSEYLTNSAYRIVNGESLTKSGIDWSKAGYVSESRYIESPEIMLQTDDILLSKDGTIGKIGYVDKLERPSTVASGIFVIRNNQPELISTQFIYYLLNSKLFSAFIASRTEGSVIPHLYQKDIMEFEFPLPDKATMKWFDESTAFMFKKSTKTHMKMKHSDV